MILALLRFLFALIRRPLMLLDPIISAVARLTASSQALLAQNAALRQQNADLRAQLAGMPTPADAQAQADAINTVSDALDAAANQS